MKCHDTHHFNNIKAFSVNILNILQNKQHHFPLSSICNFPKEYFKKKRDFAAVVVFVVVGEEWQQQQQQQQFFVCFYSN